MDAATPVLDAVCQAVERHAPRLAAVVVHLNDTYVAEERADDGLPGFARLAASIDRLRRCTRQHCGEDRVLAVHSGDFLAPSLLSRKDKGRTLLELMNRAGVAYVVPGNHEFDHGQAVFLERMAQARFAPLLAHGSGPAGARLQPGAVWPDAQRPWVALTGVVGASAQRAFGADWQFSDPLPALQRFFAGSADSAFHLVLTHATRAEDLALRERADFPRRSLVLGGHDHDIGFADDATLPLVFKNLANLKTVRVLLLLGAGDQGLDALYAQHDAMHDATGMPPADTPASRRELLSTSTALDRELIEAWIERREARGAGGAEGGWPTRDAWSFTQADELPADALAWRLDGIPAPADLLWWRLAAADHAPADAGAAALVDAALAQHLPMLDRSLLRDFSSDTDGLDASDESLRRGATDFGVLVADCVRAHTGADVVVLNSGSFRSDAVLPVRLTALHVAEAFLYDRPDAVVVHDGFPAEWVDEIVDAALQSRDTGAFPQLSRAAVLPPRCRLAIASYVLENPLCIDACYVDFLARHWGSAEAGRAALQARAAARVSIVDAVKAWIGRVAYPRLPPPAGAADEASRFVVLARAAAEAFERQRPYAPQGHAAWQAEFKALLASDAPSRHGVALTAPRDALRAFLRGVAGGRRAPLQRLYRQVEQHRSRHDDGIDYHAIFNHAASGIAGWVP